MFTLPSLPYSVYGSSLNVIGSHLYHCGGIRSNRLTSYCYKLDMNSDSPSWRSSHSLPTAMAHHSYSVVSSRMWFVYYSYLYVYDPHSSHVKKYRLPFSASQFHCAVSNSTHSYQIQVGSSKREVWVNKKPNDPTHWIKVAHPCQHIELIVSAYCSKDKST